MKGVNVLQNKIFAEDLKYIKQNLKKNEKEWFDNTRVLITGCAGFLGFYFMNFLAHYADYLGVAHLIGIDIFKLGKPKWMEDLVDNFEDKLEVYSLDIAKDDISDIKSLSKANVILHMASIASPTFYRKYPLETVDANVWGLRKLFDYYKDKDIKKFLFFSSSEVYGDPLPEFIPTSEDYRGNVATIGPRACYDEAKRFGETLCYIFANQYNLPVIIVRPFNNYGPGMKLDDKRVPADFAKAILENKDIVIYSDGTPTRTFCYVADGIVGYIKALTFGIFECFNIGIDEPEISIKKLAQIYVEKGKKIMGYTGNIKFGKSSEKDYLINNPSRRCPNIEKVKRLLNYYPTIGVEKGVERFLEFIKIEKKGGNL